MTKCKC